MDSVFSFVVGLLTAALSLLGFVQQHPELPQASRDQAQQIAQQAITQATQALSTQSSTPKPATQTNTGSLSVSTTNGQAPLSVTFSIQPSAGGQFIDFGDGSNPCSPLTPGFTWGEDGCAAPAYPQTFTHTYTSPGVYKVVASRHLPSTTLGTATITVGGSNQSTISVPGMTKYTDANFGFSFWYPTGWSVLENAPLDRIVPTTYADGTLVKRLVISGGGRTLYIDEVHSDSRTFNVNPGACGSCAPVAYSFNPDSHLWMMTTSNQQPSTQPANISNNSMGGLHIFPSGQKESAVIVPLSARNFVFVKDMKYSDECGSYCASPTIKGGAQFLAKTIVATDPSVATPVSATEQTATIQAAASAYSN